MFCMDLLALYPYWNLGTHIPSWFYRVYWATHNILCLHITNETFPLYRGHFSEYLKVLGQHITSFVFTSLYKDHFCEYLKVLILYLLIYLRQELVFLDNEIVFNEALIEERDQGIQEIQHQITEVNEIFKDLAVLVHDQGAMIGM